MLNKQKYIICLLCLIVCFLNDFQGFSQQLFPSDETVIKIWETTGQNNNKVYVDYIHSVQMYHSGLKMSYPIMQLYGNSPLELHFDDLDQDVHTYYYTIEHYDALWQRFDINQASYLDGFFTNLLNDYEISTGTVVPYRHYVLQIPNRDLSITRSGNYLLKIFETTSDNPVITQRFTVYEDLVDLDVYMRTTNVASMQNSVHLLEFNINTSKINIADVFADLQIAILPNNIWHLAETGIQPLFIRNNSISYQKEIAPLNEFRTINLKEVSLNYSEIQDIVVINSIQHVKLVPDAFRILERYRDVTDMNGLFYVEKFRAWDFDLQADYVWVYFSLQHDKPLLDGQVYVYGALSDYSFSPSNIMVYNMDNKTYENRMLLKQGFYDYYYVHVANYDSRVDFERIEGSFAQTSNNYIIYVYFRDRSLGLDRLVGYNTVTSFPK